MSSKKKDNKNTGEKMDRKEEKVQEEVVAESMDDIEASAEEDVKEEKTEEDMLILDTYGKRVDFFKPESIQPIAEYAIEMLS